MSEKRVLVVSELFYPLNTIGAIRPTKLAKYLAMEGYHVDVFTSEKLSTAESHSGTGYHTVSVYKEKMATDVQVTTGSDGVRLGSKKRGKLITEMAMTYRQILQYKGSNNFVNSFSKAVDSGVIVLSEYDSIFTTFGPVGSLLIGLKAKKYAPGIYWICDFRDPMVSKIMPMLFAPFYGYLQRKSVRLADHVTTVSHGYKKRIMPEKYWDKCTVIPNGYDEEDRILGEQVEDNKMSFAYTGALYEGKRDLGLLFKAIREAVDSGLVGIEQLVFHYAGSECRFLREQARRYGMECIIEDHGSMPRTDCLELQASVRFLVMSTWNDKGEEGVFPGKLVEYMLMKKPVINIVGGRLANSEVTQIIHNLQLGVSCEEADATTYEDLKQWLVMQCEAYNAGHTAVFMPKVEDIEARHNWKNIVKRFGELIEG